jgi:CheY-like chemotaxis protein
VTIAPTYTTFLIWTALGLLAGLVLAFVGATRWYLLREAARLASAGGESPPLRRIFHAKLLTCILGIAAIFGLAGAVGGFSFRGLITGFVLSGFCVLPGLLGNDAGQEPEARANASRWTIPLPVIEDAIDLPAHTGSGEKPLLEGHYILWVDDRGLGGTEGIEAEFQRIGVTLTVTRTTEAALTIVRARRPDAVISDIAREGDLDAGFRMAEMFRQEGVFDGPFFFYAGDKGHGRVARAARLGAIIYTEPEYLIREVRERLMVAKSQASSGKRE